ncbi:MAG: hypothetical protein AB1782_09665 [Cyanobacteriota bacterium]
MSSRGIYNKLLELRESKDLANFHWSAIHKCIGIVDGLSADIVRVRHIDSLGEEDGFITIPTSQISHIIEDSKEVREIKQYLIQKSLKL